MATTENTFTGNGSTTNYSFTFPYIKTTDVKASINGTDTTAFTLANATTVQFNTAPANSAAIRIYRVTDDSALPATFYAGSSIKSSDLNDNFLQNLYANQEGTNNSWTSGTKTISSSETWAGNNTKIATTGAIDGRVDAKIDTALGSDVLAGTDLIKTVSGGQVTVAHNVNGANSTVNNSNGSVIQDITISAQGHVTSVGSIDLDGRYYTETELNAGQLDNRYYTETETGSLIDSKIDTAVTTDILAGQSITKTNGSGQVTISIANGAIGTNQIADDAVTLAKLGSGALPTDITVASANIVNGTIVDADISTGTLDGRYYTETELNAGQLDNRYYTETELNAGQLDNRYYTETEADARFYNLTSGEEIQSGETWSAADNKIATTAAIDARITDLVDDVGGFVPIANETSFPNANPDINNGAGTLVSIKALSSNLTSNGSGVATVTNGTVGNSTVTINGLDNSTTYNAGFGMIVETTTTLNTYTFHRQVPKATEVTTVAGNISNINSVAGNASNINSAVSNASNINSAVSNASNINSVAGNISNVNTVAGNNTNINTVAGANSNISTVATNITNVNNVGGSISNVNTVAGNLSGVNSFGERYRVASSAPGSGNDEGDLYFDTTANELKVYNGSAWQGGVTASGNFASTTGNTFTGSNTYQDNVKAQFGTGNDLQIYHDGTKSVAANYTGDFHLRTSNGSGSAEEGIIIKPNGATELYYDGSKKLYTVSDGTITTGHHQLTNGNLYLNDNYAVRCGNSGDLQIYHNGSHTWIDNNTGNLILQSDNQLLLKNADGNETYIACTQNGTVELYFDNSKKLETTSSGVKFWGTTNHLSWIQVSNDDKLRFNDGVKAAFGNSDDLKIYHDGSNSRIEDTGTGRLFISSDLTQFLNAAKDETTAEFIENGACQLYYDNVKKFETTTAGAKVTGEIQGTGDLHLNNGTNSGKDVKFVAASNLFRIYDDVKLTCGTDDDLQIYHTGTVNEILSTNGALYLKGDASNVVGIQPKNGENSALFFPNGAVELYHDNSKKFETTSTGVDVTGILNCNSSVFIHGELNLSGTPQDKYLDASITDGTTDYWMNFRAVRGNDASEHTTQIRYQNDGAVELNYDGSKQVQTFSSGLNWQDNKKAEFGNSGDLQIYHDGSHSYIDDNGTGNLYIRNTSSGNKNSIWCGTNGAVNLYYDDSKKLETTSTGVNVTGALSVNGSAIGGGTWEILGTHDFASNNATNVSNTGWPSTYTQVKCVLNYVGHSGTSDLSMQWYFHSSYGNNGTLNTQTEYKYAATWQQFIATSLSTGSNDSNCWRFSNGGGRPYWSGEITFDIGTSAKDLKKWATAELRTGSNWVIRDSCQHQDDSTLDQYIVGCKLFEHGDNNFTHGRVTWYGLKYA